MRAGIVPAGLLIGLLGVGVSCTARSAVAGKYVSDSDSKDYIELMTDGTFTIQEDGGTIIGTYSVSGAEVSLALNSGGVLGGKIEGRVLTDTGIGKRWTRQ